MTVKVFVDIREGERKIICVVEELAKNGKDIYRESKETAKKGDGR